MYSLERRWATSSTVYGGNSAHCVAPFISVLSLVQFSSLRHSFSIIQCRSRGSARATSLIAQAHPHTPRTFTFPWDRGPAFVLKPSSQTSQSVDNTSTLQHRWPPGYWYRWAIGKGTLKRCGIVRRVQHTAWALTPMFELVS